MVCFAVLQYADDRLWSKDNGVPEIVGASVEAGVWRSPNSFACAYLTQRLSVAVQRGNAASNSVLGKMKMGSQEEEFFV